jgi:hypothetical protein
MKVEDLAAIRHGAELQSIQPYMEHEINGLMKAVVSFVLGAVNTGSLTPEVAFAKWVEYVSYVKLQQKIKQRIEVGRSIGEKEKLELDKISPIGYTTQSNT